jgi:hypothetical protein
VRTAPSLLLPSSPSFCSSVHGATYWLLDLVSSSGGVHSSSRTLLDVPLGGRRLCSSCRSCADSRLLARRGAESRRMGMETEMKMKEARRWLATCWVSPLSTLGVSYLIRIHKRARRVPESMPHPLFPSFTKADACLLSRRRTQAHEIGYPADPPSTILRIHLDAQGRVGWMIPTPTGASVFGFTPTRFCYHSAPRSTIRCDCYSLEDSDFHYPRDVIQIR